MAVIKEAKVLIPDRTVNGSLRPSVTLGLGCSEAASTKLCDKLGKCLHWTSYSDNDKNESISRLMEVMMGDRSITVKQSFDYLRILTGCLLSAFAFCSVGNAFWEQGHHVIAVMAYEQLEPDEQAKLIRILKHHPRFEQDFTIPESIKDDQEAIHRWWIGQAGYWPDLIRGNEKYDRPTWHYQLGATLVIGDVEVPEDPGPLPEDATLETRELYIVQAIELCRKVFHDKTQTDANRAIALCWLAHLVADAHQPCHAGSLYSPIAFPDGDRGANGIPIRGQGNIRNLHAFWDSLLGDKATPESVGKRVEALRSTRLDNGRVQEKQATAKQASLVSGPHNCSAEEVLGWLGEVRGHLQNEVYAQCCISSVLAVERGLVDIVADICLGQNYVDNAVFVTESRSSLAATRLARSLVR